MNRRAFLKKLAGLSVVPFIVPLIDPESQALAKKEPVAVEGIDFGFQYPEESDIDIGYVSRVTSGSSIGSCTGTLSFTGDGMKIVYFG